MANGNKPFISGKLDTKALRAMGAAPLDARQVLGAQLGAQEPQALEPPRPPLRWLSNRFFAFHRAAGREYRIVMTWEPFEGERLKTAIAAGGPISTWEYQLICVPEALCDAHPAPPEAQTEAASTGCNDIDKAWDFIEDRLDLWLEAAAKADKAAAKADSSSSSSPGGAP